MPVLAFFLKIGPESIGTNKIVGTTGALVALIVYWRAGYMKNWRSGIFYVLTVGVGSVCGSLVTPRLASVTVSKIVFVACMVMAILVVTKKYWWPTDDGQERNNSHWLLPISFIVGFYDGSIGPGGGTFMLLCLLLFSSFGILESLALSKMANTASAGFSLVSYSLQGHVHLLFGIIVAVGMSLGAFVGARAALKNIEALIRPLLFVITVLLLWKLRSY